MSKNLLVKIIRNSETRVEITLILPFVLSSSDRSGAHLCSAYSKPKLLAYIKDRGEPIKLDKTGQTFNW
jgi:hypothetical protein